MGVRLSATNGAAEIRRVAFDWTRAGQPYTVDLEVVADADGQTIAKLACSEAGWIEVSDDAGATWAPVPETVETGVELGPLAANERKAITLRLTIPGGLPVRQQAIELYVGLGM